MQLFDTHAHLDDELAPLSVRIHGDLNVDNIIYRSDVESVRLIDVHRSHLNAEMRDVKQEISIDQAPPGCGTSVLIAQQLVGQLTSPSHFVMREEMLGQLETALAESSKAELPTQAKCAAVSLMDCACCV